MTVTIELTMTDSNRLFAEWLRREGYDATVTCGAGACNAVNGRRAWVDDEAAEILAGLRREWMKATARKGVG